MNHPINCRGVELVKSWDFRKVVFGKKVVACRPRMPCNRQSKANEERKIPKEWNVGSTLKSALLYRKTKVVKK